MAKEGTRAAIAGVSSEASTKQVVGPGQDGGVPGRGNVTSMTFGAMVGKRSESTVGASGAVSRWWGPWVPPPVCTQLVISSSLVALNTDYALMAFEYLSPGWAFPRASDNGMQLLFRDPIGVSAFTSQPASHHPLPPGPPPPWHPSTLAEYPSVFPGQEGGSLGAFCALPFLRPPRLVCRGVRCLCFRTGSSAAALSGTEVAHPCAPSLAPCADTSLWSSSYSRCVIRFLTCDPLKIYQDAVSFFLDPQ